MMDRLTKLYNFAKDEEIEIYDFHFSDTKKSICIKNTHKYILLDKNAIEDIEEEITILKKRLNDFRDGTMDILKWFLSNI